MSSKQIKVQKARSFFCDDLSIDKDIKRHREYETRFISKIEEMESKQLRTVSEECILRVYRGFLSRLHESKELLASRIGANK